MKTKLSIITLALLPCLAAAKLPDAGVKHPVVASSDAVIVKYKKNASAQMRKQARSLVKAKISDVNADEIDDNYKSLLSGRLAKFKISGMSTKEAIARLKSHQAIEYVEPDYQVSIAQTPDDPRFDELWGLNNDGQTGGTADADIDAVEAWDISTGSRDVVVGVIDTGIDYSHSDLASNMWVNSSEVPGDGIDNDGNGFVDDVHGINAITNSGDPMDDEGHGTHVSGTIGASGNNATGVVGVNHEVSLVGCKFLDAAGNGSTSDAIKCIDYMVGLKNAGVNLRVLNNSWGGGGYSQALADAIASSEAADLMFVAAAGNDTIDNDVNPHYPSNYENASVLSVASTDQTDNISWFSHYGLTSVDMGAPGSAILSTTPGESYASYSGTSMATPHVAGAAALVLSINPELNTQELKELLMSSGDANAALQGVTVAGTRLNVNQALIDADPTPGFKISADPLTQQIVAGQATNYTFTIGSIAQWDEEVTLELSSTLSGAYLSASTARPGDEVMLNVETDTDTQWGEYELTVTATADEIVKQQSVKLMIQPVGLNDFTYSSNASVDIPDNSPVGAVSVINVPDDLTVFGTTADVDITHTYSGDLVVKLVSAQGTQVTLQSNVGGSSDDIVRSFTSESFNGEVATGDWTLHVEDTAAADTGTINTWSLTLSAIGEVSPQPPRAGFDVETQGLTVNFTDSSTDANNDITQWSWEFGDGATSSDQNPMHVYAASGNYDVVLTVTDSEGNTSTSTQTVVVSDVELELTLKRANKSRLDTMRVDLSWERVGAESLSVYRNGELVDTTSDNGRYRDYVRGATLPSYDYQLCVTENVCSNIITVSFN
ncbi:S8 family serine peptidase [Pseudoalteromonas sp. CST5]|uniref:S8 family serine peptidase n=1 Tax=unclassified Pseudoalteromonas TaxID=194690 RepID=UPI002358998A|nr:MULTISPECIES: S8 family serine peptidase [unclassified Pseudoalteromonas]MDC9514776.1 S8 family serine peptidase [Pseudoalteromonas sp. CST1]MDC9537968.1 S8 family serine peptidase [Pseudoalteromonas sp. CST3]MDC9542213.1 S8 family serine peptidase [Pseudoalteromonas sp. CST2]MDC9546860.1 S8 family serine peptidase [Pseudoalteromonas sp. CST4]MDC9549745.1 S8 family serine peptidase [Pseudoalteromonas sp. CST5]